MKLNKGIRGPKPVPHPVSGQNSFLPVQAGAIGRVRPFSEVLDGTLVLRIPVNQTEGIRDRAGTPQLAAAEGRFEQAAGPAALPVKSLGIGVEKMAELSGYRGGVGGRIR